MNSRQFPFRDDVTSYCLVHIDKKGLCNHQQGCYRNCPKHQEAAREFKVNEKMRLSAIAFERMFVVRSD